MLQVRGKNGVATIHAQIVDQDAISQIIGMLNSPITEGARVEIMPDVHAGKNSTVGTTIKLPDNKADWQISPSIVGTDIGCGMMSYQLDINPEAIDFAKLDKTIRTIVPMGAEKHKTAVRKSITNDLLGQLVIKPDNATAAKIQASLGVLGGGNHFIEVAAENDHVWLTVHSGSSAMGIFVANNHQQETPLTGGKLNLYLNDMTVAQQFAHENRRTMLDLITNAMKFKVVDSFDSIHNYIDTKRGIIRKGATSASRDERLIIPLNMKDGSLICRGKGNRDWNYSAPHSAGRLLKRGEAKETLSVETYKDEMNGIYSSGINRASLDESPMAYKPYDAILDEIQPTAEIESWIKPLYNCKA